MKNDKKDPYNSLSTYTNNKDKKIKGLTRINNRIVHKFLNDMAIGLNVSGIKGARTPIRLNNQRIRLKFIINKLQERKIINITKTKSKDLHNLFSDMRKGIIKNRYGLPYKSTADYIKAFKTFWHWFQKVEKKKGNLILDVTEDLDTTREKAKFVYFTEQDFQKLIKEASYDLKPVISLAYDTGMRVTELVNIKVSDFSNNFKELDIREETSKTFGRKIKIMLCSEQIKEYIKNIGLKSNDYLTTIHPSMINKELRIIGKKVLTPHQIKFKNLTLYDFRHSSACFWLPKYKSESALKYRFGWLKTDMIHYYTEFLGMKDTIKDEDMYEDITKTELEKELKEVKTLLKTMTKTFIQDPIKKGGDFIDEKELNNFIDRVNDLK